MTRVPPKPWKALIQSLTLQVNLARGRGVDHENKVNAEDDYITNGRFNLLVDYNCFWYTEKEFLVKQSRIPCYKTGKWKGFGVVLFLFSVKTVQVFYCFVLLRLSNIQCFCHQVSTCRNLITIWIKSHLLNGERNKQDNGRYMWGNELWMGYALGKKAVN